MIRMNGEEDEVFVYEREEEEEDAERVSRWDFPRVDRW